MGEGGGELYLLFGQQPLVIWPRGRRESQQVIEKMFPSPWEGGGAPAALPPGGEGVAASDLFEWPGKPSSLDCVHEELDF